MTPHRWGPVTREEFLALPDEGIKREWIDGELPMVPAGIEPEGIGTRLIARLSFVVERDDLGGVYGSQAGFWLNPDWLRVPDVSFVRRERFPDDYDPPGLADFPPDLAVESLAPQSRSQDLAEKLGQYFAVGVSLVWVIDPTRRTVTVYRSLTEVRTLHEQDTLDGEDVVPGFSCPIQELFARVRPAK